jgi:hypothetical protein
MADMLNFPFPTCAMMSLNVMCAVDTFMFVHAYDTGDNRNKFRFQFCQSCNLAKQLSLRYIKTFLCQVMTAKQANNSH